MVIELTPGVSRFEFFRLLDRIAARVGSRTVRQPLAVPIPEAEGAFRVTDGGGS